MVLWVSFVPLVLAAVALSAAKVAKLKA
jgi:hypothetical protein